MIQIEKSAHEDSRRNEADFSIITLASRGEVKSGAILSISSHVVRGHVGNAAAVFALRRIGLEVYEVPTLVWNHHPGHGAPKGLVVPKDVLAGLLAAFTLGPWAREIALIVTGYMRDAGQVEAVADAVASLKAREPSVTYVLDPVSGDRAGPYVPAEVIDAIGQRLLPIADAITPNRFELGFLAKAPVDTNLDIVRAVEALRAPLALVSSAHADEAGRFANLLVEGRDASLIEVPALARAPNGTGDLLTALFAGQLLLGSKPIDAAKRAVAAVHDLLLATARTGRDELSLVEAQAKLERPETIPAIRVITP